MSIYEYNEEYIRKTLLEEGQEIGYAKGKAEMLVVSIRLLMKEMGMDQEKACQMMGVSLEEYQQAKKLLAGE